MTLHMILATLAAILAAVLRCQGEMAARVETFSGPAEGDLPW